MKKLLKNKKGTFEIDQLQTVVITLVVVGILLGLGLIVMSEFYETSCDSWNETSGECTTEGHATSGINDTRSAIGDVSGWLSLIVLVLVIGIILAIVFKVLPGAKGATAPMDY